jgi:hypothetical protein
MIDYFHIVVDQRVVATNIPQNHKLEIDKVLSLFNKEPFKIERIECSIEKKEKRHGIYKINNGYIYLVSFNRDITNSIFKRYFETCSFFIVHLEKSRNEIKLSDEAKFKRLKHNLITHNTTILQSLYNVFPQVDLARSSGKQQVEVIKSIINKKSDDVANTALRILKSANLMRLEFEVFDMMNSKNPFLQFDVHSVHKIVLLSINPFWLDFIEKNVEFDIGNSNEKVVIDYKSISVTLSHLFDNTVKYVLPGSEITIRFKTIESYLEISLEMTSLKITNDDYNNLFLEDTSGEWPTKLGLNGSGVGMFVVKNLLQLNDGGIIIEKDIDSKKRVNNKGIPFERNRFKIRLKSALQVDI